MTDCGLCDDGPAARAVVQVDCMTDDGKATVYCCAVHMVDGYCAAVILSDHEPVITVLNGAALASLRCPRCGQYMTIEHAH